MKGEGASSEGVVICSMLQIRGAWGSGRRCIDVLEGVSTSYPRPVGRIDFTAVTSEIRSGTRGNRDGKRE